MDTRSRLFPLVLLAVLFSGCGGDPADSRSSASAGPGTAAEPVKGPHGGRLLSDGNFTLELAIFETGVPPEFRAWLTERGRAVKPDDASLHITLTRLGDRVDAIGFRPEGDFLRGDTVIDEPHSFVVSIEASHDGNTHRWEYDNFEGRTTISAKVAGALGVETAIAGPATLRETITVFGRIEANAERVREVSARFDGVIQSVHPSLGDTVHKGQPLATVESNESLKTYTIDAPISGVITRREANPGEVTGGRALFTITDVSSVWADLQVFPADRARVRAGQPVTLTAASGGPAATGR
ncbi:MAG: biotin/lipoyl attachment domain-containing protein, partial [Gammaproteobacteria bacterium]